jgi:hypothetical protein
VEIVLAAFIPPLVVVLLARRAGDETRRAFGLFAALTVIWLLPCWATLSTNAPLDYLTGEPPWKALREPGYLTKNFLLNDVVMQLIPLREAARESIFAGELPLLNRHAASGTPLWENMQLALLYPINVAGLLFSSFAWPLFSASAKLLLAACGTYLFIRRLGCSHLAAVFAAIAYAFGAFNVAFLLFPMTNVTALLPLLLVVIHDVIARVEPKTIVAAVLVTCAVLVGGHPESVLHVAIVAIPFAIHTTVRARNWRGVLTLAGVAVLAIGLAAPLLIPFANWVPHSERMATIQRSERFLATSTFSAESFIPFVIPNYFGNPRVHNYRHAINFNELCTQYAGLATLILAIAGMRKRNAFWIALLAIGLLLAIMPGWVAEIVSHIPLLNITANARMRFAIAFVLAVLAAFGFDERGRDPHPASGHPLPQAGEGTRRPPSQDPSPAPREKVALTLSEANGKGRMRAPIIAAVAALLVIAIAVVSYPLFAQYGIRRLIFFTELAALLGAAAIVFGHRRALPLLLFFDLASVMALYNPAIPRTLYYPEVPAIAALQKAKAPLRVAGIGRSLLPNSATMYGLEEIRPHDPLAFGPYVDYLTANGFDRSDYFGQFNALPSHDVLQFLGAGAVIDGTDVHPVPTPRPRFGPNAELLRYGRNGATIRINGPALVESSEPALPGWRLERDGNPWPNRTHRGAFLAWDAPAGTSTFTLRYVPEGWAAGWWAAVAAGVLTAVWAGMRRRRITVVL